MNRILDFLFDEGEMLSPRVGVGAALLAYILVFFVPVMGVWTMVFAIPILVIALGLVCYAVIRLLLPLLDPRNPDSDELASWAGVILFLVIGIDAFGIWFAPGLVLGALLIWWRVPELLEVFPWIENRMEGRDR